MRVRVMVLALLVSAACAACGQRGSLYIPGKPGDPYFDRQNRGVTPAPGNPSSNGTKPAAPPKREDDSTS